MSAMKEVEEADKKWLCMLFGIPYEAKYQGNRDRLGNSCIQ